MSERRTSTKFGDKIIDIIPDGSNLSVAPELVNFVHCQGTGYYLTYLPFVGLTSQGSKTSGYNLEVIDNSNGTHLLRRVFLPYEELFAIEMNNTIDVSLESQGNGVSFHRETTTSSSQHNVLLTTMHNGDKYYLLASSDQSVSFVDEAYKTAKEQNQQNNPQAWIELLFNIISVDKSTVNTPFLLSTASNAVKATSPIALSKL